MPKLSTVAKTSLLSTFVLVMTSLWPTSIYASKTGVNRPVGADAGTYSYNEKTNLWENDHFIYNPSTGLTTPKDPVVYTYNNATGKWDTTTWEYNSSSHKYVAVITSVSQPPVGATKVGGPPPPPTATSNSTSGNGTSSASSNSSSGSSNSTTAGIGNTLNSQATSGDANVSSNTSAGNASTGNAQAVTNLINMLQSSSNNIGNGSVATFTSNINGDVNGDILLDPAKLATLQPANASNLQINSSNDLNSQINNDLTLGANSGNATIDSNSKAGSATTGSANAVANVINVINSAISSGQSFLGVMNINGNLNGDILLPPHMIDQLLAANAPHTTIDTSNIVNNKVTLDNNTNQSIDNNVTLGAQSGSANIGNNTNAGSANTGNAATNLTIFNLSGSNVVGTNNLLVFVNVLGSWVGMIINAPKGTTAASLGGGITKNTIDSAIAAQNNTTQSISNNIHVTSQSGDANVTNNTNAGNATTGNATSSVNLLNVLGSHLSLSDWFGVLFINVFGTWHGSFGVNTSAGDPARTTAASSSSVTPQNTKVFRFIPTGQKNKFKLSSVNLSGNGQVKGESSSGDLQIKPTLSTEATTATNKAVRHDWALPIFGSILGTSMLGGERLLSKRKK